MDPAKLFKFLLDNSVDLSRITILTLIKPVSRFKLVQVGGEETSHIIITTQTEKQLWLHPKLLIYSFLSIVLGLLINSLIPYRKPGPDITTSVAIIFAYWLAYGSFVHVVCRVLRGRGEYLETLSVFLQVSASLYIVTSFFALLGASLLTLPEFSFILPKIQLFGTGFADGPVFVFFLTHTILSMIYLPLSMKPVHKFGIGRTLLIAILPFLVMRLNLIIYFIINILFIIKPT